MNENANLNILLFLVTCASFNGNAQGNNPGPNPVAGGGVQGQGNNPNQNPVAGGGTEQVVGNSRPFSLQSFGCIFWHLKYR